MISIQSIAYSHEDLVNELTYQAQSDTPLSKGASRFCIYIMLGLLGCILLG